MIAIPTFKTKSELFHFLRTNKSFLINAKKNAIKYADSVNALFLNDTSDVTKAIGDINPDANTINAKLVINTTNFMDSHSDVHINGIWKKTLQENKNLILLQEHQMQFDKVITDKVTASAKMLKWSDLGYSYAGSTEALVFDVIIDKGRNPYMFDQYVSGYVNQHSVGMRYVKIEMAINSMSQCDAEEKAIWDKYYPMIANKEAADEQGYFWAVLEAKAIEGSAVVKGSNSATPIIDISEAEDKSLPTNIAAAKALQDKKKKFIIN